MIYDKISNNSNYYLPLLIQEAFNYLSSNDLHKKDGRFEIEGENLFCIISNYLPKEAELGILETHQKYIDLQIVLDGEEICYIWPQNDLKSKKAYSPEKDAEFYNIPSLESASKIILKPGMFAIFFPEDAHMPQIKTSNGKEVKKVVFKIKV